MRCCSCYFVQHTACMPVCSTERNVFFLVSVIFTPSFKLWLYFVCVFFLSFFLLLFFFLLDSIRRDRQTRLPSHYAALLVNCLVNLNAKCLRTHRCSIPKYVKRTCRWSSYQKKSQLCKSIRKLLVSMIASRPFVRWENPIQLPTSHFTLTAKR